MQGLWVCVLVEEAGGWCMGWEPSHRIHRLAGGRLPKRLQGVWVCVSGVLVVKRRRELKSCRQPIDTVAAAAVVAGLGLDPEMRTRIRMRVPALGTILHLALTTGTPMLGMGMDVC